MSIPTGSYKAAIDRTNPACLLFLVDRSGSMADVFGSGDGSIKKMDGVSDALNKLLQNLCVRCAREQGIRDWFHVGVIGYGGTSVGPAFGGALTGQNLVPVSEIASKPARVEVRTKKVGDGAGGLVDQTVKFPIWFDPVAIGGTPMCQALGEARKLVETWVQQYPDGFPPIVINITDGESGDGNPTAEAEELRRVQTSDGGVLLFNLHLSSQKSQPIEFPASEAGLPDQHARLLYDLSSPLPPGMVTVARESGFALNDGARGFAFNADLVATINFLDIGTRASNVR